MNYRRLVSVFILALVTVPLLLAVSCGRGSHRAALPELAFGGPEQATAFSLEVLADDSSAWAAAPFDLTLDESAGQVLLKVVARNALALESLFFNLHYDANRFTPLAAQAMDVWVRPSDSLTLEVLDQPGVVAFAQVPIAGRPVQGVTSKAVLAQVLFKAEPFAPSPARCTSRVPTNSWAFTPLLWYPESDELKWYYVNPGDFNQDGIVSIQDITPLAASFTASGPFRFEDAHAVIDSNHDGEVTIGDLSAIAQYFGNTIDGYNLYHSNDVEDVPNEYAEPSTLDPVATIPLSKALGASGERSCTPLAPCDCRHGRGDSQMPKSLRLPLDESMGGVAYWHLIDSRRTTWKSLMNGSTMFTATLASQRRQVPSLATRERK